MLTFIKVIIPLTAAKLNMILKQEFMVVDTVLDLSREPIRVTGMQCQLDSVFAN